MGPGLTIIKHGQYYWHTCIRCLLRRAHDSPLGRRGKPAERILYADPEHLQVLHWCDTDEEPIVPDIESYPGDGKGGKRSVSLVNVTEIRRGVDLDPLKAGYCGTAVLRKHCEPVHYAYSFSLITPER